MSTSKLNFYYQNVPRGKPLSEEMNGTNNADGRVYAIWDNTSAEPVFIAPPDDDGIFVEGIRWYMTGNPTLTSNNLEVVKQELSLEGEVTMYEFTQTFKNELLAISEISHIDATHFCGFIRFKPAIFLKASENGYLKIQSASGSDTLTSADDKVIFKLEGWFLDDEDDYN